MAQRLAVESVGKQYDGKWVLEDVSITVTADESVGVIGPSGAGKTTLLRILAGAIEPDAGSVQLDGEPVTRGDVALAYQGDAMVQSKTAAQNVALGQLGTLSPLDELIAPSLDGKLSASVRETLAALGLADLADSRVDQLSAGERSRVAVARALVQSGPAILADEPTANLDRTTRRRVLDAIDSRAAERVQIVVLHNVSVALDRYDRILGLRDGQLVIDTGSDSVSADSLDDLFEGTGSRKGPQQDGASPEETETDPPPWHV
jgi:phosphonate transport system ATP-binding protein